MNDIYMDYLSLVALVAAGAVLAGAVLCIVRKARGKGMSGSIGEKDRFSGNPDTIQVDGGNVSIFFDRRRNVVLIPYVPDIYRSGKATDDIIWLDMPYKPNDLGKAVKIAMSACRKGRQAENGDLMKKLGAHSWKEFTDGKLSVSVYYKEGRGIMMNSTVRTPEGAYVYIRKGPQICLSADTEDYELGGAILELHKKCR